MRRLTIREKIPPYLHHFIAEQNPALYSAIDQATWRYILRVSMKFFEKNAHRKYLDGLRETGLSEKKIPLISEIDECLELFGWRAVAVVGFIPPAVFMEFLSIGVLPIACDIRTPEHLAYTPAPDIVHEAAGHAPIIADQEYADYLHDYGEIAHKVIFSKHDMNVYESIRALSDIKEDPHATESQIARAQQGLDAAIAAIEYDSEAALLSRMGWWTFEYGLIGSLENPKIYGAGLLSSISESQSCLGPNVKKIPFSTECIQMSYDITRPQPQLYVASDFQQLSKALEELASTMAYRRGGTEGLEKALRAQTVTTTVLDIGIQVSGILSEIIRDAKGQPCYLRYTGPCQLASFGHEIVGQGADYHKDGFGMPFGALLGKTCSPASLLPSEIGELMRANDGALVYASGVKLQGRLLRTFGEGTENLIHVFEECSVTIGDRVLFRPEWGLFELVSGKSVVSVFGGAADRAQYLATTGGFEQKPARQKSNLTSESKDLNELYQEVRQMRESGKTDLKALGLIQNRLDQSYKNDWLLRLELLELSPNDAVRGRLAEIGKDDSDKAEMIRRGLELLT